MWLGMFLIAFVVFWFSITAITDRSIDVPTKLQAEFVALRFTSIPECFAFSDSNSGRVQSGTIDLDKFITEQLNSCYSTELIGGTKEFNFRLELKSLEQEIITDHYVNSDDFTLFKEILVYRNGKWVKDDLLIHVQEDII